jgi:hypothetical protein
VLPGLIHLHDSILKNILCKLCMTGGKWFASGESKIFR